MVPKGFPFLPSKYTIQQYYGLILLNNPIEVSNISDNDAINNIYICILYYQNVF